MEINERTKERPISRKMPVLEPCFSETKAEPLQLPRPIHQRQPLHVNLIKWICSTASQRMEPRLCLRGWDGYCHLLVTQTSKGHYTPVYNCTWHLSLPQQSEWKCHNSAYPSTLLRLMRRLSRRTHFWLSIRSRAWQNQIGIDFRETTIFTQAFHATCACICALGKSLRGRCSGFE